MRSKLADLGNGAHALATQILGNSDDAYDAVQDAYVRVLSRPGGYDPEQGSLSTWFLSIVRNGCIDQLRKRKPTDTRTDSLADAAPLPVESLQAKERDQAVREALDRLPVEQRQLLVLRDYLDFSYSELAIVLDIKSGTVMSRLHRARLALKRVLEDYEW